MAGNNTDWGVPTNNVVSPPFAGPGESRIEMGTELPPPLDTYLFAGAQLAKGGIIFWSATASNDDYQFFVVVEFLGEHAIYQGTVLNGAVLEHTAGFPAGQSWVFDGAGQTFSYLRSLQTVVRSELVIRADATVGFTVDGPMTFDGVSAPRALCWSNGSTAVSTATGIGNWVIILADPTAAGAGFAYQNGRAYEFKWRCLLNRAATGPAFFSIRRTTGSVLVFDHGGKGGIAGVNVDTTSSIILRNVSGVAIQTQLGWYLNDVAGTTAGGVATSPCEIECFDVGAAADFPFALQI